MAMSKKDFIALADELRGKDVNPEVINSLCRFMKGQNYAFNESRWRDYLAGDCGPSGGNPKCDDCEGTRKAWKVKVTKYGETAVTRLCTKCCDSRKSQGFDVVNA